MYDDADAVDRDCGGFAGKTNVAACTGAKITAGGDADDNDDSLAPGVGNRRYASVAVTESKKKWG